MSEPDPPITIYDDFDDDFVGGREWAQRKTTVASGSVPYFVAERKWPWPQFKPSDNASIACTTCSNIVTLKNGDPPINHGDERLCEHMGGPRTAGVGEPKP